MQQIFAKISDNKVIEYPVTLQQIENRRHHVSDYTPCQYSVKPFQPKYHTLKERLDIFDDKVLVTYDIQPMTFRSILNIANQDVRSGHNRNKQIFVKDINQELLHILNIKASEFIQVCLDDLAKQHKFDSMVSLISWLGSENSEWVTLAKNATKLRDTVWKEFIIYMDKVKNNEEPLFKTPEELLSKLPKLTLE